jgi:preprotein translocase subunit SecG
VSLDFGGSFLWQVEQLALFGSCSYLLLGVETHCLSRARVDVHSHTLAHAAQSLAVYFFVDALVLGAIARKQDKASQERA